MSHAVTIAERAVTAVHELAHLTRPAITTLDLNELRTLAGALAELAAALPQTLHQLSSYPTATDSPTVTSGQPTDDPDAAVDHAPTRLRHASAAAAHLAAALAAAHQTLSDIAETTKPEPKGVNFQPAIRGQFSTGIDSFQRARRGHKPVSCLADLHRRSP